MRFFDLDLNLRSRSLIVQHAQTNILDTLFVRNHPHGEETHTDSQGNSVVSFRAWGFLRAKGIRGGGSNERTLLAALSIGVASVRSLSQKCPAYTNLQTHVNDPCSLELLPRCVCMPHRTTSATFLKAVNRFALDWLSSNRSILPGWHGCPKKTTSKCCARSLSMLFL